MEAPACVQNAEKVIDTLGYWPGFHDAEVISVSASRSSTAHFSSPFARLCVNVRHYHAVGEGTADYEIVCSASFLIEFLFNDLRYLSLEEFNHQNVIDSIEFTVMEDQLIEVNITSIWGLGGVIRCTGVEVADVTRLV